MDLAGWYGIVVLAAVVVAWVTSSCWVDSNWCPSYLLTYWAAFATDGENKG